jgi:asparagine synthase (glutamine-hydrolysing)
VVRDPCPAAGALVGLFIRQAKPGWILRAKLGEAKLGLKNSTLMCGIAGIFRPSTGAPGDAEAVARMLTAQIHRGPDGDGLFQDSRAVLGHRRLSIIDLSADGRQPMSNEDGSIHVTFNGEIYNYRELRSELLKAGHVFRSHTDTEVLLHGYEQWGIAGLLERLRGMFAFALYDVRRGLILARDRLGIKPLYYHAAPDYIVFASEVKALLRSGLTPEERDRKALTGFLIAGTVPAPLTFIKGVSCLPAGHWGEWKDGELNIRKYWDLECPPRRYAPFDAMDLRSTLEDAVRRHLISDVPLGVFLSGGVDSAGLVALASRIRREQGDRLTTLTVVFDEKEYSEANPAAEIATHFGTLHREIRVTSEDFRRELPAFMASMDQPTNDGVNSWFVSRAARAAGLTVVLSGLGGDEVFWGYKHYKWLRYGHWASACPGPLLRLLARSGYQWGRLRGRDNWMRTAWLDSGASSAQVYLTMRGFFAPDRVARLMDIYRAEVDAAVEEHFGSLAAGADPSATDINYLEMKRYLHDQLLRDTDVFSMAHSIEARVPYLDHVLVERLWNVEPELKLNKSVNKPLLVDAVNDAAVLAAGSRPKRGFTFPMAGWMKTAAPEMREMAEAGSLVRSAVRECWGDFSEGRMHWSRAWALTVLGGAR